MAIKGKSKSRSAKAVTRGPKPAYVPVTKPLLARRGFWIGVACVLGALLIAGLWYGFAKQASQNREDELAAERVSAVDEFGNDLDPILATVGQPLAPVGWSSFPQLEDAVAQLESGGAEDAAIVDTGSSIAGTARTAWGAMQDIDGAAIVRDRGLDEAFVILILGAQDTLVQSLKLYEQVGELVATAARTSEGPQREALIERSRGTIDVARALFEDGYGRYIEARALAGVLEPGAVPELPPLPTGASG